LKTLSVVTTLYFSEHTIQEFDFRIRKVARDLGFLPEVIYVNDGSPDLSGEIVINQIMPTASDSTIYVELSRNFGHHKALLRGIREATGDYVFIIDSDLEEAPELLINYWAEMTNTNADLVEGFLSKRKGTWSERIFGDGAWRLIILLTRISIVPSLITARLFTKRFQSLLLTLNEKEVFIAGLFSHVGLKVSRIEVSKTSKTESTYSFRSKIRLTITGITSYSETPLKLILSMGLLVFGLSCAAFISLISLFFLGRITIPGWTSIMLLMIFLNSIVLISIGTIGLYILRIFGETKDRPLTLDSRVIRNG
jgi:putative glycosyltransferase